MNHSFNVVVAQDVGVLAATVFNSIGFWVEHNRANNDEMHDGRYWTYNTVKAWTEQFPYASANQIDYALKKLRDRGYILTGRYSKNAYDRTLWYTLTDKGQEIFYGDGFVTSPDSISENSEMDFGKLPNTNKETVTKQDTKQDIVPYDAVVTALNDASGKHFKAVDSTKKLIRARWSEGYRLDDFQRVIEAKVAEWRGTDMEKYIRPATLFSAAHFDAYLNQSGKEKSHDLDEYDY